MTHSCDQKNLTFCSNVCSEKETNLPTHDFDWEYNLKLIVAGIASKIGEDFFQVCVHYLAEVLQIKYALIAEFVEDEQPQGRVLSFWAGEGFGPNFEYNLAGTPCGLVYQEGLKIYPHSIQQLFPEDEDLLTLEAESYLGIAIVDSKGKTIGHLAGLHTEPLKYSYEQQESILKIFAARSAAEIERQLAEKALNQVFMNILNNAIDALHLKFNKNKFLEEQPRICVRTEKLENNWIGIYISDNGLGMTEENRSKIFDPFFTTKPVGQGTGLGLSISYQIIVEQHEGRIQCISSPGKGTEFAIEIPI